MHAPMNVETALSWLTTPRPGPMSDAAALILSTARRETVHTGGEDLAVWRWGEGPLALLVHGWEGHAGQFHAMVPLLLDAGYAVAAPDMPAHGASTGRTSNVVGFGRAAHALMEELGPVSLFVGHSVGAVAGYFAFAQGARAARSIHIAGPASLAWAIARFAAAVPLPRSRHAAFREAVEKTITYPVEAMEAEVLLNGIAHPGAILHDPDDTSVPFAHGVRLAALWPQAAFIPVPGAGHIGILSDPRALAQIEQFLQAPA